MLLLYIISIFLYGRILFSVGTETIWNNLLESNTNITCSDESLCIIQCTEYSCGSIDPKYSNHPSYSKPHIICPLHGSRCIINCMGDGSCSNNIITTGYCEYVEINVHSKYNEEMVINAPINGDLYINLISEEAMFNDNIIHAHDTNSIIIDCNGKGSCYRNQINAETVTNALSVSCRNGINCNEQEIHCPDSIKPQLHPECTVICDHDASCSDLNIFAMNGTNKRNGVTFECDKANDALCDGSTVYCRRDKVCDMQYEGNKWQCIGSCGDTTSIPTKSPTTTPTFVPTLYTTMSIQTTEEYISFASLNTSDIRSDIDINAVVEESTSNVHHLQVVAYISIGGLIGGCLFCICIICGALCLIERRIHNSMDGGRGSSSISFEYYGAKEDMEKYINEKRKNKWKFGSILIPAIKYGLDAIVGVNNTDNGTDNYNENDNDEGENVSLNNDIPCNHCSHSSSKHKQSSSRESIVPHISKGSRSRESKHKKSSSSSSSSTTYDDEIMSSSETSEEYEHQCYVEIMCNDCNHHVDENECMMDGQSIAISVQNDVNDYASESSSECAHCSAERERNTVDEYYDEDDDDDIGPKDSKRYRIEVSAPIEHRSSTNTETGVKSETDNSGNLLKAYHCNV